MLVIIICIVVIVIIIVVAAVVGKFYRKRQIMCHVTNDRLVSSPNVQWACSSL